uniref:Uncharacterized protein n=1 Tax=Stomoxys calcitrans TaxID=35570 RepID=A0A1I8NPA8_STOCA
MPCILAVSVLDNENWPSKSEENILQTSFVPESSNEHKIKINWLPVWNDIEGSNEFVVKESNEMETCSAESSKGLLNLMRETKRLLPLKGIKTIINSYANDAEVKALKDFITSSEYKQKTSEIRKSEEYKILKSYACHVLHIDLEDLHSITKKSLRSAHETGIRGLMLKIQSILPYEKIMNLYQHLMGNDNDLVEAVAHLKSQEFRQIVMNLWHNVPAYREVREKLIAIGVPMDDIRDAISSVLGWNEYLEVLI